MIVRLQIILTEPEVSAIRALAEVELRPMRDQIRFLLRQDLQRRGLLPELEVLEAPLLPVIEETH